jgi:hypothetical protein
MPGINNSPESNSKLCTHQQKLAPTILLFSIVPIRAADVTQI